MNRYQKAVEEIKEEARIQKERHSQGKPTGRKGVLVLGIFLLGGGIWLLISLILDMTSIQITGGTFSNCQSWWCLLYILPLIYLGILELNPGEIHLQVLIKDFSGKEASKEAFIDVRIPE